MKQNGHIGTYLRTVLLAGSLLVVACNNDREIARNVGGATSSDAVSFSIKTSEQWAPDVIDDGIEADGDTATASTRSSVRNISESVPLDFEGSETFEELLYMYMIEEDYPEVVDTVKRTTRAAATSPNDIGIYAYHTSGDTTTPFMSNVRLLSDGTYQGETKYWPGNGTLKFYAYRPYYEAVESQLSIPGLMIDASGPEPTLTYTVPADVADQRDLMAGASGEYNGNLEGNPSGKVEFSISHLLSQINVKVGTMTAQSKIKSISFDGIQNYGTRTISADNWSNQEIASGTSGSYEQSFDPAVETTNNTEVGSPMYLMPQKLSDDASITIVLEVTHNNPDVSTGAETTITKTYHLTQKLQQFAAEWEPNKQYTYVISSPEEVQIEISDEVTTNPSGQPVKENLTLKNTGLSTAYVRVAMVGNWVVPIDATATIADVVTTEPINSNTEIIGEWKYQEADPSDNDGTFDWGDAEPTTGSTTSNNWCKGEDGYYYYMLPVARGESIEGANALFQSYTLTAEAPMTGAYLELVIAAQAVRTEDAQYVWPEDIRRELFPSAGN